jgi:predicted secreted protein with PEFG-CTERM motif
LIVFSAILFTLVIFPAPIYAEHIFEDGEAFAQQLDISQISAEKFVMIVDDTSYDMYYGYHGSLDSMASDKSEPVLSSMSINQERMSLEITFSEIPANSVFWVRMPNDLISAEKGKFKVFVDGKDTLYDLTIFPNDIALGMIVPKDGRHVEIIGTNVIPEFGSIAILILVLPIVSIVVISRKFNGIRF